ncbi:MAG: HAD-IIIA family hydrolase, partial [Candidatus Andersenbacteria bacterium]
IDGVIEGCKKLQDAGYTLAIITNQSGIAQGLYTEEAMHALHAYMLEEFEKHDVHISVIAYCPHGRDQEDCNCRKPNIGMAIQIEEKIGAIDYENSWTIGDKEADLMFGKNAGTHTALIASKYWGQNSLSVHPDLVVNSLLEAAQNILHT